MNERPIRAAERRTQAHPGERRLRTVQVQHPESAEVALTVACFTKSD